MWQLALQTVRVPGIHWHKPDTSSYRVQKDPTWDSTIGLAASPVCPSGARSIDLTLQISFGESQRLVLFAAGKPIYGCCPDVLFQDKGLGSPFLDPVTSECQSVAARNR